MSFDKYEIIQLENNLKRLKQLNDENELYYLHEYLLDNGYTEHNGKIITLQQFKNNKDNNFKTNQQMRANGKYYNYGKPYDPNTDPYAYTKNGRTRRADDIKRSGSTYTKIKKGKREGMIAVTAWRKTKLGLMTAKAFPVSEEIFTSQNGNEFMRYAVEVSNSSMGTNTTYWCLMSLKTKKLVIQELNLVISPNGSGYTSSGKKVTGYFGANYKRR